MFESSSSILEQFKQEELSDLISDLNLSKQAAEIYASQLKDKKWLKTRILVAFYCLRETELLLFVSKQKGCIYCKNIQGLLLKMGVPQYRFQE